jgi:hypothetical protein
LTRNDQHLSWGVEVDNAFQSFKASFHICSTFDSCTFFQTFSLGNEHFQFAFGIVLSQLGENNVLHHVNFYSHKFSPTQINYKIHD